MAASENLDSLVFILRTTFLICAIVCAKQTIAFLQGAGSWVRFLPRARPLQRYSTEIDCVGRSGMTLPI
jgi:hypothetical protein